CQLLCSAAAQPLSERLDSGAQFFWCGRLVEVDVGPVFVTGQFVRQCMARCDHDDADTRLHMPQATRQAEAILTGQVEVEYRYVCHKLSRQLVEGFGAGDANDVVP